MNKIDLTSITNFLVDQGEFVDEENSNKIKILINSTNFSKEKLSLIKSKIVKKVVSKNLKYSSCTSKELRNIISKEIRKPISMRHARRILHKIGFSLITPRSQHVKNDPLKVAEFRREFKKNSNPSFWIIH